MPRITVHWVNPKKQAIENVSSTTIETLDYGNLNAVDS